MAVGRITGPLLKKNLLREGIDLAFETDLLYLDVVNGRIGIHTTSPTHDLQVVGTTRTTNLEVGTQAKIASFTIEDNVIASSDGTIVLQPSTLNPVVYQGKIITGDLQLSTNTIETLATDQDLLIKTLGTGKVNINANVEVYGNIHATGNITADGNITIGDENTDNIVFNADINSNIIPETTNTWNIGSNPLTGGQEWKTVYTKNVVTSDIVADTITVNGINLILPQGNAFYVDPNGNDDNSGSHENDPFLTLKHALSQATSGDTIFIFAGTYREEFPLTVPAGVTVRGAGIRAVKVIPTVSSRYKDAFILNGETTVEDLTVADYFSGGSHFKVTAASLGSTTFNVGTAPFAHTYVNGGKINIAGTDYTVTGATYNHLTGVVTVTHATGTATLDSYVFVSGLSFSCNSGIRVFPDNGYAFRFATDFNVTSRSPYIRNVTVITRGSPTALSVNAFKTQNNASLTRIKNIIEDVITNGSVTVSSGNIEPQIKDFTKPSTTTVAGIAQTLFDNVIYVINNGTKDNTLAAAVPNGSILSDADKLNAAALIRANINFLKAEMVAYLAVTYPNFWTTHSQTKAERDLGYVLEAVAYDISHGGNNSSFDAGLAYWQRLPTDPYGFDSADAGKGAYIDGAYALVTSKEAAMLFHSVTFITPNVDTIVTTNGSRIEWLNSFTYFANKGINAFSSNDGFAGQGKTRLRISNRSGLWNVGNTLSYYGTDGTTLLASGTIESIEGEYINLTGRRLGFETITDRAGKTVFVQGDAKLSTAQKKFGTASLALDGTGDYITVNSNPDFAFGQPLNRVAKSISAYGEASISSAQSKFGGSSIVLDGQGDYLLLASNTDFAFGTGDFTLEGWFYKSSTPASTFVFDFRTTATQAAPTVYTSGNSLIYFVNGANQIVGTNALPSNNAWYHIALSRSGTDTKLFVDGNQVGPTWNDTTNYIQSNVYIGARYGGASTWHGYIDEIRISKGIGRYTANFAVPTAPFVNDANTVLLIHGDTNISDDGGATADFTIETWVYRNNANGNQYVFDLRTVTNTGYPLLYFAANTLTYVTAGTTRISGTVTTLSAWVHVAVVRHGSNNMLFVNGTQLGSTWVDSSNWSQTALTIGGSYVGTSTFSGYIDDFRITKGVAKYTTNFTVPTAQLTGDLSTVLLLNFNGANNSTAIIDSGITYQDLRTSAGGTANLINFTDYSDFGSEIRSIGSANVYGNYGTYGDGEGVVIYLISQNYAYVGSGKKSTNDPNDRIASNEVVDLNNAKIYYTSVDNEGNFSVGDSFYVNQKTGDVLFNNQSLSITAPSGVIFTDGIHTTTITSADITTGNIRIYDNNIDSLTGDISVNAASGVINLQNDTYITGNLDITGNLTIGGNIQIGDQTTDSINFVGTISSNLIPTTTATYNLGQGGLTPLRWKNVYLNRIEVDSLVIDNNVISTTLNNDDLQLTAAGTGRIYVPSNNVAFDQNLTVGQNLTVTTGTTYLKNIGITGTITQTGNINQTGNFTTSGTTDVTGNIVGTGFLELPQIKISGNLIETRTSGTDLQLNANGTGNVVFEGYKVSDNNIQTTATNANVVITPQGTGSVVINSNQSLIIPVGTTSERPASAANGMIRYNTTLGRYEGYNNGLWLTLSGVQDVDGNTYIKAEATPGANDNTLYFYADNTLVATIDTNKFYTPKVRTNNLEIYDNTITTLSGDSDINLTTTGLGGVKIGNLRIRNNTITNVASGAITEFVETGTGYVKVAGTNGFVIPSGMTTERPGNLEVGMTRFNTTLKLVEVWNGVSWTSVAGESSGVTTAEASDLGVLAALLLG